MRTNALGSSEASRSRTRAEKGTDSDRAGAPPPLTAKDPREATPTRRPCSFKTGEPDWPGIIGTVVSMGRPGEEGRERTLPREVTGRFMERGKPDTCSGSPERGSSSARRRNICSSASVRKMTASAEKSPGQISFTGKIFPRALRTETRSRPATTWAAVRTRPSSVRKHPEPIQFSRSSRIWARARETWGAGVPTLMRSGRSMAASEPERASPSWPAFSKAALAAASLFWCKRLRPRMR